MPVVKIIKPNITEEERKKNWERVEEIINIILEEANKA